MNVCMETHIHYSLYMHEYIHLFLSASIHICCIHEDMHANMQTA